MHSGVPESQENERFLYQTWPGVLHAHADGHNVSKQIFLQVVGQF